MTRARSTTTKIAPGKGAPPLGLLLATMRVFDLGCDTARTWIQSVTKPVTEAVNGSAPASRRNRVA